jgi:hypothetical protein
VTRNSGFKSRNRSGSLFEVSSTSFQGSTGILYKTNGKFQTLSFTLILILRTDSTEKSPKKQDHTRNQCESLVTGQNYLT